MTAHAALQTPHAGDLLAILPPLFWIGWTKFEAWRAERERQDYLRRVQAVNITLIIDEVETRDFGELPQPRDGAQPAR